jgi:two-component system sensor histidine kinase HydH
MASDRGGRRDLDRAVGAARALAALAWPLDGLLAPDRELVLADGAARFDTYEPQPRRDRPARLRGHVVVVHGGGFTVGSPRMKPVRVLARALVDAGYGVLAVAYPLVRGEITLGDQVDTVKRALSSVHVAAGELGWRPAPRFGVGFSAGATLLLLAADALDAQGGSGLDAIASIFGLYDFRSLDGPVTQRLRAKVLGDASFEAAERWSPLSRTGPNAPITLIHGDADRLVDVAQAEALHARRLELERGSNLVRIEGAGHAFFNHTGSSATRRATGEIVRAFDQAIASLPGGGSVDTSDRVALETLPIAAVVVRGGIIESVNAAYVGLMGYDAHELVGRNVSWLIQRDVAAADVDSIDELSKQSTGEALSFSVRARDAAGRYRTLRVLVRPTETAGSSISYLVDEERDARVRELTDAMNYAGGLLANAATEEEILQRVVDALVTKKVGATFVRFSADRKQLEIGPTGSWLPPDVHASATHAARSEFLSAEAFLANVPGFSTGEVTFFSDYDALLDRTFSRQNADAIKRLRAGNGVALIPLSVRGEPFGALALTGKNLSTALETSMTLLGGQIVRAIEALRTKREQLERERLAALGEAAAVMAHEVRNPVAAILAASTLLGRRHEDFETLVGVICEESRRLDRIVSNLLTLGRPLSPELRPVEPREFARLALEVHRQRDPSLARSIELAESPAERTCVFDPDLVQLALLNVLRNAAEAIDAGGRIRVGFEPRGDEALAIVVDDSGPGLASEVSARLFEPFFTTRPAGTGVGLAVVRRVVEACHGRVEATRGPLGGARIALIFPAASSALADPDPPR